METAANTSCKTPYWNKPVETMPREQLQRLQLEKLQNTIRRVYQNVPVYRGWMQEKGVSPEDIKTLDDIRRLPFTQKTDLRDNYPYGLFAAPQEEIVRIHASSGTTGKPIVAGYTANDVHMWAEVVARCLGCAHITRKDTVQDWRQGRGEPRAVHYAELRGLVEERLAALPGLARRLQTAMVDLP